MSAAIGQLFWPEVAAIILLAGFYTVFGFGMNMSALDMTRVAQPIGKPVQSGSAYWTQAYATLVVLMWWIMMFARHCQRKNNYLSKRKFGI